MSFSLECHKNVFGLEVKQIMDSAMALHFTACHWLRLQARCCRSSSLLLKGKVKRVLRREKSTGAVTLNREKGTEEKKWHELVLAVALTEGWDA